MEQTIAGFSGSELEQLVQVMAEQGASSGSSGQMWAILVFVIVQSFGMGWFLLKQLVKEKNKQPPLTEEAVQKLIEAAIKDAGLEQAIRNMTRTTEGMVEIPLVFFDREYIDKRFKQLGDVLESLADSRDEVNKALSDALKVMLEKQRRD